MRVRNFDGDLVTSGANQFLSNQPATGQSVKYRLLLFLGEYMLDYSQGTPWFQGILGKSPRDTAEANLKNRIVSTPGVIDLTEFTFDLDQNRRRINVAATVTDESSESVQLNIDQELF